MISNKLTFTLFVCGTLLCGATCVSAQEAAIKSAEGELAEGQIALPTMSNEILQQFLPVLYRDELLQIQGEQIAQVNDPAAIEVWRGNPVKLRTELKEFSFSFYRDGNTASNDMFQVRFRVDQNTANALIMGSNRPKRRGPGVEVGVPWGANKTKRIVYPGQGETSFVAIFPSTMDGGSPGFLLCPRVIKQSRYTSPTLMQSDYELKKIHVEILGTVNGDIRGDRGVGHAVAELKSTPSLAPPFEAIDESWAMEPEVRVDYRPRLDWTEPEIDWTKGNFVAGLDLTLKLQRSNGFRKTNNLKHLLWVSKIFPYKPINVVVDGTVVSVGEEACYLTLFHQSTSQLLDREAIELPDRFKGSVKENKLRIPPSN